MERAEKKEIEVVVCLEGSSRGSFANPLIPCFQLSERERERERETERGLEL